jgi:Flp pilus assembly protein TadD
MVALGLVLLAFSAGTVVRNAVWSDPVVLWQESVDLAPAHYRPRLLLGEALQDAGRRSDAMDEYRTAIRLRPADPTAYVKLGLCFAEIGRFAQARAEFLKAIEVDAENLSARKSLVVLADLESRIKVHDSRR